MDKEQLHEPKNASVELADMGKPAVRTPPDNVESGILLRTSTSTQSEVDGGRRSTGNQTHTYDIHKGIAESAMDISLLTANANQLRLLITYNGQSKTYIACITLVIVSLVLQILIASGVIIIKSHPKSKRNVAISRLKIVTSIGLTIVTVINILVASLVVTNGTISS